MPRVAIVGTGFAGLGMAIRLIQAGYRDLTLFEKSDRVGGTWRDNTYPGSGCDVPSHLYSYSFEPKADWSRRFSEHDEILAYIEHCVKKYGLRPYIRFNTEIESARFDDEASAWRITTKGGEQVEADILVTGTGQLNRPHTPRLPGIDSFEGRQFHSARWDHDYSLKGRRIAVIGNGASAIQFIPRIAPDAGRLTIYQRTANWMVRKPDRAYNASDKWLFRNLPGYRAVYRAWIYWMLEMRFFAFREGSRVGKLMEWACRRNLEKSVADPEMRRVLTPDYPIGCKRVLISNDFYEAVQRPNVAVVTDRIERVEADAVVTANGQRHPTDTIIYATGFETTDFLAPIEIEGPGGLRLADAWREGAEAFRGVAVAGFPNLFMLYGPNTNLGHNSIIFMIECQVAYVMQCLEEMRRRGAARLEVKAGAMRRYNEEVQDQLRRSVWNAGCDSWYKTESGRITNNWPRFTVSYWREMKRPDFREFELGA
jgi:cation diffusion facilitator CzcD-associated flavoprotein CzcO